MTYEEAYLYMKEAGKRGSVYGTETVKELLLRLEIHRIGFLSFI